jgi:Raf kinase inhibitor-like YbhB/YbcL family protein
MIGMLEEALDSAPEIEVTSPDFEEGGQLPDWTGFVNENQNPSLELSNVPDDAESLVVSVIHPEAAEVVDHPWLHWLAWDIDPEIGTIPRGWLPTSVDATEAPNDFLRDTGYGGPSPPPESTETYRFRVYALDTMLDLPSFTRRARLASTIGLEAEILAAGELTGEYSASQGTIFVEEGPEGLRPSAPTVSAD